VYFKVYFFATLIGALFDLFSILVILKHFSVPGEAYQELSLLGLTLGFWATNAYWVGYVFLLCQRFPDYINKYLSEALFSMGSLVDQKVRQLGDQVKEAKPKILGKLR